jgi:hypothetical protein
LHPLRNRLLRDRHGGRARASFTLVAPLAPTRRPPPCESRIPASRLFGRTGRQGDVDSANDRRTPTTLPTPGTRTSTTATRTTTTRTTSFRARAVRRVERSGLFFQRAARGLARLPAHQAQHRRARSPSSAPGGEPGRPARARSPPAATARPLDLLRHHAAEAARGVGRPFRDRVVHHLLYNAHRPALRARLHRRQLRLHPRPRHALRRAPPRGKVRSITPTGRARRSTSSATSPTSSSRSTSASSASCSRAHPRALLARARRAPSSSTTRAPASSARPPSASRSSRRRRASSPRPPHHGLPIGNLSASSSPTSTSTSSTSSSSTACARATTCATSTTSSCCTSRRSSSTPGAPRSPPSCRAPRPARSTREDHPAADRARHRLRRPGHQAVAPPHLRRRTFNEALSRLAHARRREDSGAGEQLPRPAAPGHPQPPRPRAPRQPAAPARCNAPSCTYDRPRTGTTSRSTSSAAS